MAVNTPIYTYGVIKVYYPLKGFGFITRTKGRDLFFNRREISSEAKIIEGATVKFKIVSTINGDCAVNIEREG